MRCGPRSNTYLECFSCTPRRALQYRNRAGTEAAAHVVLVVEQELRRAVRARLEVDEVDLAAATEALG